MDDHTGILQQRIQVAAVRRRRQQAIERIGSQQHKQHETDGHQPHHAHHARDQRRRQVAAEYGHRDSPHIEHQHPQQQRAFVRAPRGRKAVKHRQLGVGVGGDVEHREIVLHERPCEARERYRYERELALRRGTRYRHPGRIAARRAGDGQHALDQREQQREYQCKLAYFWNHVRPSYLVITLFCAFCACSIACLASGGM